MGSLPHHALVHGKSHELRVLNNEVTFKWLPTAIINRTALRGGKGKTFEDDVIIGTQLEILRNRELSQKCEGDFHLPFVIAEAEPMSLVFDICIHRIGMLKINHLSVVRTPVKQVAQVNGTAILDGMSASAFGEPAEISIAEHAQRHEQHQQ